MSDSDIARAARLLVEHDALIRDLKTIGSDDAKQLGRILGYLWRTGVPAELLSPVMRRLGLLMDEIVRADRSGISGSPRPISDTLVFVTCAATVTALKERGMRIADAIKRVADESGVDAQAIESYRDNINRGLQSDFASQAYREYLDEIRDIDTEQSLRRISGLSDLLVSPPKANTR